MTRLLALLLLSGAALAQERAFVEVTAEKDAYYVRERIRLTLRFGFDRDFFRTNAVPLFARAMDVPVQVQAQLPGWPRPGKDEMHPGPTFALNDGLAKADSATEETRDGRTFTVVEMLYDDIRPEPGDATIAAPTLRYAYATEFDEDFVTGRVARNPKQEVVAGRPLTLRILRLPEEGRPREFNGAVGRYTMSAGANRTTLSVGETLTFTLKIEGDGNVMGPALELPGFHLLGTIHKDFVGYVADHHLKVLSSDVKEIPAIPFAFFDPGPPAGYRVIRTDPIPLEIRKGAAPEPPPPPPAQPRDRIPSSTFLVVAALGVATAALALWARARRRAVPPDPETIRVQAAAAALRARIGGPGQELADAFAELLAVYLRCPPAAVIGPDLPVRLARRGMDPGLASRAAATLERLVAARYGGGHEGAEEIAALLPEIEAAIGGGGSPP